MKGENMKQAKGRAKRRALSDLKSDLKKAMKSNMSEDMKGEDMAEMMPMKVTVAAKDKKGLKEGMSKAQQIMEKMGNMEMMSEEDPEIDNSSREKKKSKK